MSSVLPYIETMAKVIPKRDGLFWWIMTPKQWRDATIGKEYDTDGFPRTNPYQCWDYFDVFCREIGFTGSRYCALTKYVGDLWNLRDEPDYHYYTAFDYIIDLSQLRDGDWIFWEQHVAMYYNGYELGQNQPDPWVTEKEITNWGGILGAMRYKHWDSTTIAYGSSDVTINNHSYSLYRQSPDEKIAVIGAGRDKVAPFKELTAEVVYAKAGGANYYQMRNDIPGQPYGMTFGDVSSTLSDMYQCLPNQDSTLFYELESARFGDCTGYIPDRNTNVFSPALVYPNANGNFEYARMVGLDHKNYCSRYAFVMRMEDGYCLGIANEDLTPTQIASDFYALCKHIAFLDGGGSAQMGRWTGTEFQYVRDTGRPLPSVVAIYKEAKPVQTPEEVPDSKPEMKPDEPVEEETPSEDPIPEPDVKPYEPEKLDMQKVENWKDPEGDVKTFKDRAVNLLSLKSMITMAFTAVFLIMVLNEREIPNVFMYLYMMCMTFYFGYQFTKGEK